MSFQTSGTLILYASVPLLYLLGYTYFVFMENPDPDDIESIHCAQDVDAYEVTDFIIEPRGDISHEVFVFYIYSTTCKIFKMITETFKKVFKSKKKGISQFQAKFVS